MVLSKNRSKEIEESLQKFEKEKEIFLKFLANIRAPSKVIDNVDILSSKQVEILKETDELLKKNEINECRVNLQRLLKMWELANETCWLFEPSELEAI